MVLAMAQPATASAQTGYIGVKAGFVSSDVSSDPATSGEELGDTSSRNGFAGGVVAGLRISPKFSVSAEGLYSQKGFKLTEDGDDGAFKFDVIEIPVLANLHLGSEEARFSPRLYAGPWMSFEASCEVEVGPLEADCDDLDEGAERKTTDYGLIGGVALDILEGLRNLDASPDVGNLNVRTRGFTVSAGVGIPLGD